MRCNMSSLSAVERAKFMFDLNGFIVVRGVLSPEQVKAANDGINAHKFHERVGGTRNSDRGTLFEGDSKTGRFDMAGMLGWEGEHKNVFREMLAHPKLVPYIDMLVGKGYRLDHSPLVLAQEKGSEGFKLHGGSLRPDTGEFIPSLQYVCKNGGMYNTLIGVSYQLTDHNPGDGGFAVVKGSHKINFAPSTAMLNCTDADFFEQCVSQPVTKAGDVVLFSEATIHGCLPWTADIQRRVALFRFSPAHLAFARGYTNWPQEFLEGMTDEQLACMLPPYHQMYDRPLVAEQDNRLQVQVKGRSEVKKQFDKKVFGTDYY